MPNNIVPDLRFLREMIDVFRGLGGPGSDDPHGVKLLGLLMVIYVMAGPQGTILIFLIWTAMQMVLWIRRVD